MQHLNLNISTLLSAEGKVLQVAKVLYYVAKMWRFSSLEWFWAPVEDFDQVLLPVKTVCLWYMVHNGWLTLLCVEAILFAWVPTWVFLTFSVRII